MANKKKPFNLASCFFSTLTIAVLLFVIGLIVFFIYIFVFPDSEINPFPPINIAEETSQPILLTPTQAPTLEPIGTVVMTSTATAVSENTVEPTQTIELSTATLEATSTFVPPTLEPTSEIEETVVPSPTPSNFTFIPQTGSPVALSSAIFYPELGCNTMIIAGQVFNKEGVPITQQNIILYGDVNGSDIWEVTKTGDPALNRIYGPGAYEFRVSPVPVATNGYFSVAVITQDNHFLSAKISVITHEGCDANLILLNFAENIKK